ncbi:MAG: 50S ribosome-binding GTPase [Pirellulales bacterium]
MTSSLEPRTSDIARATLLTPQGRGAVAVVRLSSESGCDALTAHFLPASGRPWQAPIDGRICYGRWRGAHGVEDVVVARRGDDWEICCHGGDAASRAILDDLATHDVSIVLWTDCFDRQPAALAQARTLPAALVLARQSPTLLATLAERASGLRCAAEGEALLEDVARLHATARWGKHLIEPWRIVIAGPPNVGKSRLLNALTGYDRAIVFDQPGTTRDVVTALVGHDGWIWEVSDTAGIRALDALPGTQDELEAEGIARAEARLAAADAAMLVFDGTQPWNAAAQALVDAHPAALVVFNKCDLAMTRDMRPPGLAISAERGIGLDALRADIHRRLDVPPWSTMDAVIYDSRMVEFLDILRERVRKHSRS